MPAAVLAAQLQARTEFPPCVSRDHSAAAPAWNSPAADQGPPSNSLLREELADVSPTPSSISTTPQGPLVATVSTEHRFQVPGCTVRELFPACRARSKPGARARSGALTCQSLLGVRGSSTQFWCLPLQHPPWEGRPGAHPSAKGLGPAHLTGSRTSSSTIWSTL